jgi:hypothetical protein
MLYPGVIGSVPFATIFQKLVPRITLVNMPFAIPHWPSLRLGLPKAGLAWEGIDCDIVAANTLFTKQLLLLCRATAAEIADYRRNAPCWERDRYGIVFARRQLRASQISVL